MNVAITLLLFTKFGKTEYLFITLVKNIIVTRFREIRLLIFQNRLCFVKNG